MFSVGTELRRALEAFRRTQGSSYLQALADPGAADRARERHTARRFLGSDRGIEQLREAQQNGELSPSEYAALCAHMARAVLETHYAPGRLAALTINERPVSFEGETRRVGTLLGEWSQSSLSARRTALERAVDAELQQVAIVQRRVRAEAEARAAEFLGRLGAPRHPDAGPEGGSAEAAEAWLSATEALAAEAFAFARRLLEVEGKGGLDTLYALSGAALGGLFPREGRLRRLAADWEPLGMRTLLRSHARAGAEHPGPFPAPHVVVLAAPRDIRVCPSAFELSFASELSGAEAVGRALGHAHASAALPLALRHASVGTVARAAGALSVLRFAEPVFLRRVRGLVQRESQSLARLTAAFALADSRLAAAAVLARRYRRPEELAEAGALASRALLGSLPVGWAALLITRLSPGGPFRAKSWAPALLYGMRERFDEDWFLNPRASEPLRGALARAGEFSVEAWAEESGVSLALGTARLAELF